MNTLKVRRDELFPVIISYFFFFVHEYCISLMRVSLLVLSQNKCGNFIVFFVFAIQQRLPMEFA